VTLSNAFGDFAFFVWRQTLYPDGLRPRGSIWV